MASTENEYPYAPDQFDYEADRAGAHGAHREDEPFWKQNLVYIVIALVAILVLVFALWIFGVFGGSKEEPAKSGATQSAPAAEKAPAHKGETPSAAPSPKDEAPTEEPTPEPKVDKSRDVLVLNGTRKNGLAAQWQKKFEDEGWEKVDTDTGKRTKNPGVYYKKDEDSATAKALADSLGVEAQKSSEYRADLTVVITKKPN